MHANRMKENSKLYQWIREDKHAQECKGGHHATRQLMSFSFFGNKSPIWREKSFKTGGYHSLVSLDVVLRRFKVFALIFLTCWHYPFCCDGTPKENSMIYSRWITQFARSYMDGSVQGIPVGLLALLCYVMQFFSWKGGLMSKWQGLWCIWSTYAASSCSEQIT